MGTTRRVERFSNQHWTLVYLLQNPQWTGRAILLEKQRQRGTVIIPELGLETKIYLSGDPPLNAELTLSSPRVDLAELSVHFQAAALK